MKVVVLAGGYGTRISEESSIKPKPMVEIGDRPILWHIMKMYSVYGINEFIVCCGYKGFVIKEYFANYFLNASDVTFDLKSNQLKVHENKAEPWKVTVVDTGEKTMTGGRIKCVKDYIGDSTFCLTYGDGLCDVDIGGLIRFHHERGVLATLTAVQPPGRFGAFHLNDSDTMVSHFREKPVGDGAWVNGGFFVLEPQVINYIDGDTIVWEKEPMEKLAATNQLSAYRHFGFWQPMDTLRDKHVLEELWESGKAPWKTW
ncbi:MAG: glucose-1-phosphate cytidylyltransferase [Gammaproteobacteria bacterium]